MRTAAMVLISLACLGCDESSLTGVPRDLNSPRPAPRGLETHWTVIADRIDRELGGATPVYYPHTQALELVVKTLRDDGKLDAQSVQSFYASFPGIQTQQRPLTGQDSANLRRIAP